MALLNPIYTGISPIQTIEDRINRNNVPLEEELIAGSPSFLDVFKNIAADAVETNQTKTQDMIDIMLGNTDDIEAVQANIAKAEVATELLVTVKNTVVEAYNEIIKMSI